MGVWVRALNKKLFTKLFTPTKFNNRKTHARTNEKLNLIVNQIYAAQRYQLHGRKPKIRKKKSVAKRSKTMTFKNISYFLFVYVVLGLPRFTHMKTNVKYLGLSEPIFCAYSCSRDHCQNLLTALLPNFIDGNIVGLPGGAVL